MRMTHVSINEGEMTKILMLREKRLERVLNKKVFCNCIKMLCRIRSLTSSFIRYLSGTYLSGTPLSSSFYRKAAEEHYLNSGDLDFI